MKMRRRKKREQKAKLARAKKLALTNFFVVFFLHLAYRLDIVACMHDRKTKALFIHKFMVKNVGQGSDHKPSPRGRIQSSPVAFEIRLPCGAIVICCNMVLCKSL